MNNLWLTTNLKVPHGWRPFEKSHMVGHNLIFDAQRENIFEMYLILDFDIKVFELKFNMTLFGSHLI